MGSRANGLLVLALALCSSASAVRLPGMGGVPLRPPQASATDDDGGATTSKQHTAVKIAPHYDGPVVYVPDASRSVSVGQALVTDDTRDAYIIELAQDYERIRIQQS